jgi:all-trans-retinol dehydrogenase (NAD+)
MKKDFFAGKRVLITGAASGLGRLLSEKLAGEGAEVIAWDIDGAGLSKLADNIGRSGGSITTYTCDLSNRDAISETSSQVINRHDGVDILINNAGVVSGQTLLEIPDESIKRTFAVNALAPIYVTRAFLPGMIARGAGHIVTISSAGGIAGTARLTDYNASKFAAFGFDDALRIELKQLGHPINTTVVCPFFFESDMFRGVQTRVPWLLPILDPEKVANRTIRAIRRGHRRLVMPWFVYTTFLIRLLPVSMFDRLADIFGVSTAMEHFEEE